MRTLAALQSPDCAAPSRLRRVRKHAALDPVTLEVIRNALPAVANEMAADLQRTSYNMMIYEVRDFCTALIDTKGQLISQNVGGVSHFVADLGVHHRRRHEALRRQRLQARRRDHHQSPGGRRPAPQQRRHLHALFLQGRAADVLDGARALDRRRRNVDRLRRRRVGRRSLVRGAAARPAQDLSRRASSTRRSIACSRTTSVSRSPRSAT